GKSSDQRSQARAGRGRGALLLTVAWQGNGSLQRAVGAAGLGHRRWRSMDRALGRAPWFGLPSVTSKRRRPPALLGVGSPKHLRVRHVSVEWATESVCQWAKTTILDATQITPTPIAMVALHAQIYFTAWVACAREMKAPTFLVAIDRCRE